MAIPFKSVGKLPLRLMSPQKTKMTDKANQKLEIKESATGDVLQALGDIFATYGDSTVKLFKDFTVNINITINVIQNDPEPQRKE